MKSVSPYIYIGYYCNNNCIFCSESDEYLEKLEMKTLKKIKEEVLEVRKNYDFVSFMGREPTLRKDFPSILKFAKKLNFGQISVATNGRMFSYPEFAKKILSTGLNQVGFSLSGAKASTHDKQTRVIGSFNQTIQGISNVIRMKKPEVSVLVNITLNRLNYLELDEMIKLLIGLGVKEINILFIAPLSRRSRTKKIVMRMSELGKFVFKTIKKYLKNSELKILLVEFLPCSLPRKARDYFFPCLEKNSNKRRIPLCKNCEFEKRCDGVLQSYIDLYGIKEFKLLI